MTLSLPIPGKKEKVSFFFIPYKLGRDYVNNKGEVHLRESDSVREFREEIKMKYGVDEGSYLITTVTENALKKMVD